VRFLWASALKDLRRLRRDPVSLAVWVGIPVFIAVLLSIVFHGGAATPQGRLLVVDEDESLLSSLVSGAFGQGPLSKMLVVETVKWAEGRKRIDRGDGSALLVIPKGFSQAFLRQEPSQLRLITNPSQRILPGIIEEAVSMLLEAGFYLQALAGDQLRMFAQGPPHGAGTFPDQTVIEMSVAFNRLGAKLHTYFNPLLIQLETTAIEEKSSSQVNFAAAYFPSMLFMAFLFVSMGLSGDLWKERARGTLRRVLVSPGSVGSFLAGKLLAAAVVVFLIGLAGVLCGLSIPEMQVHNPALAVLWIVFSGAVLYLLLLLVQLYASSERAAHLLVSLLVLPLAMLGGSFFPFEFMPRGMAAIGRLTPNGWALEQLRGMLAGSIEPARLALSFGGLALASGLAFWLSLRRLHRGFAL
jgi:ABC-type multidrug transport system permease subunit